jgi:hypothetical protein
MDFDKRLIVVAFMNFNIRLAVAIFMACNIRLAIVMPMVGNTMPRLAVVMATVRNIKNNKNEGRK